MPINDGETKIGITGPKGYLCWERAPGDTTITSKAENTATLPLKCEAGMVYYVGQHMRMGLLNARTKLTLLPDAKGKEKLSECKPPKTE